MVEVVLNEQQKNDLANEVHSLLSNEIDQVRKEAGINSKDWFSKKEAYNYLGVSFQKFNQFILEGLPSHSVAGMVRFNRQEITEWFLNQ